MRLKDKVAIVVGAGQTKGYTIGNGRATAILFAREGAKVMLVDRDLESAQETEQMIREEGGESFSFTADITKEDQCQTIPKACVEQYGCIDILHNNVGIGTGDAGPTHLSVENWDNIFDVNLKGMFLTCKYILPVMRDQMHGVIINISSIAAIASTNILAYKTSKAGVNAFTQSLAMGNTKYNIRCNAIMPGLMNTPMAIERRVKILDLSREEIIAQRDSQVPLGRKMGSAWDVAYAALFLASDEAKFITGILLPVDGGQSCKVG